MRLETNKNFFIWFSYNFSTKYVTSHLYFDCSFLRFFFVFKRPLLQRGTWPLSPWLLSIQRKFAYYEDCFAKFHASYTRFLRLRSFSLPFLVSSMYCCAVCALYVFFSQGWAFLDYEWFVITLWRINPPEFFFSVSAHMKGAALCDRQSLAKRWKFFHRFISFFVGRSFYSTINSKEYPDKFFRAG